MDVAAAAKDRMFAAQFAAVGIKRCNSNQGCYLTSVELAQFRHLSQEQCRRARTHSADCSQFVRFNRELLRPCDVLVNEQIDSLDPLAPASLLPQIRIPLKKIQAASSG